MTNYFAQYQCPCKDCDKRYTGCHDYCLEYKQWKYNYDVGKRTYYNTLRPVIREGDFLGDDGHMAVTKLRSIKKRTNGKSSRGHK